jgi:hypothetical protein
VPADGEIDWRRSTADVYALVRALTEPFPGAFTHLEARRLVIWRARALEAPREWVGRVPGRVVSRSPGEGWVDVLTGDGVLRLETVQLDGQGRRPAAEVIRSVRATLGLSAGELLERLRALEQRIGDPLADQRGHETAAAHPSGDRRQDQQERSRHGVQLMAEHREESGR